jgi:hypothetical protein
MNAIHPLVLRNPRESRVGIRRMVLREQRSGSLFQSALDKRKATLSLLA